MAAAAALTACGISPETTPRDIDEVTESAGAKGQTAGGDGQIFLIEPDAGGVPARLVSVQRDVDASSDLNPSAVLKALFDGPNVAEQGNNTTTVLPAELELLSWSARFGGIVTIDLPEAFRELSGETLILGVAQIVHTVTALEGVSGVRITVGEEPMGWPDVNGQLQNDPLTVYDYPGLVRTTQPAFPAVPSD